MAAFRVPELGDKMAIISVSMLSYISLMETYQNDLPPLKKLTFTDKYILLQTVMCLVPVLNYFLRLYRVIGAPMAVAIKRTVKIGQLYSLGLVGLMYKNQMTYLN